MFEKWDTLATASITITEVNTNRSQVISISFQRVPRMNGKRRIKYSYGNHKWREEVENVYEIHRWLEGGKLPVDVEHIPLFH